MIEARMDDISIADAARILRVSAAEIVELEAFLAEREAEADRIPSVEPEIEALSDVERELANALGARVSEAGARLMINLETGGRTYYERVYQGRPVWPGRVSGITLGVGYDLGYYSESAFRKDWALLGTEILNRFAVEGCIGACPPKKTPDQMRAMCKRVRDIQIAWNDAIKVYKVTMLPNWAFKTNAALPNCDLLNGDCFGALVALTLNRGEDKYARDGDRFKEMRAIKAAMSDRAFGEIPKLLEKMTRIWEGTDIERQMKRARGEEKRLFEIGLAAMARTPIAVAAAPVVTVTTESEISDEDNFSDTTEEEAAVEDAEFARRLLDGEVMAEVAAREAVSWAADDKSPDYAHLRSGLPVGLPFTFTSDDLELLCRLNDFPVEGDETTPILFGLRGAAIVAGGSGEDGQFRTEVTLKDIRPNHRIANCVMGVWNRAEKKIGVFRGSTVPNDRAVVNYMTARRSGNILPTGFYRYAVGSHITQNSNVPGAFLLRKTTLEKRRVVVRRSTDDLTYELTDMVHACEPGDNIHPAFSMSETFFSSFGCQVVLGKGGGGSHSGPWAKFRTLAGQTTGTGNEGKEFRYVLLTGREALIASDLRKRELASDPFALREHWRLRFGSFGPSVITLQTKLGFIAPDGDLGPATASRLHAAQAEREGGRSDGVFTPQLDEALGWGVFSGAVA
jgi:hypothetical protein